MAKQKRKTRADIERENKELHAQLAYVYHAADREIHKAGTDKMGASGVLLQLHALGGRELILPVMILDGLSADTIEALRRDLARSYQRATELKPKGAQS